MPSDAAFREALDTYAVRAIEHYTGFFTTEAMVSDARARVLALYAAPEGEVYEVEGGVQMRSRVYLSPSEFPPGARVRVTRLDATTEEGKNVPLST